MILNLTGKPLIQYENLMTANLKINEQLNYDFFF